MVGKLAENAAQELRTGTRQRLAPHERREQILAGAEDFFAEAGLEGNTRQLAQRLGVTQSLIFKYFPTKEDLIEAVYERVYLDRLSEDWPQRLTDRSQPLRQRLLAFYTEYSSLIFERNWMRIFMFSGLAGAPLNRRYLEHLSEVILHPLLEETRVLCRAGHDPSMEDIWSLHGGIVYIGIRQHIYNMPAIADPAAAIESAVDKYLDGFGIAPDA